MDIRPHEPLNAVPAEIVAMADALTFTDPAGSRALAVSASALAHSTGDSATRAKALTVGGIGSFHLGEYRRALDELQAATALYATLDDAREQGICLTWQGNGHAVLLDQERALDCYERALELLRVADDSAAIAYLMNNVALLHFNAGREEQGLAAFHGAIPLVRDLADPEPHRLLIANAAFAEARRGRTLVTAGDVEPGRTSCYEAIALVSAILPAIRAERQHVRESQCRSALGEALHGLGELTAALEHYAQAQRLAATIGDRRREALVACLIGEVYLAQHNLDLAIPQLEQALTAVETLAIPNEAARTAYLLADAYEAIGSPSVALTHVRHAHALELAVERQTAEHRAQALVMELSLAHAQVESALRAELTDVRQQLAERDDELARLRSNRPPSPRESGS